MNIGLRARSSLVISNDGRDAFLVMSSVSNPVLPETEKQGLGPFLQNRKPGFHNHNTAPVYENLQNSN